MLNIGTARPTGAISNLVMRKNPFGERSAAHPVSVFVHGLPRPGLSREVNLWRLRNIPNLFRGLLKLWFAMLFKIPTHYGAVFHRVNRGGTPDGRGGIIGGVWTEFGLASLRVVTTAGVNYIAGTFNSVNEPESMKFHGFGTGTNAEATGDTALQTELTTQYATDNTRPTGSQANSTNTYTTVATLSPDSGGTIAITEHGIFSASSGTTLLDRSVFSAVNLVAGADSLQTTYVLTFTAGG